jgi:predicted TIM-barrel fold metal-dependent hydrolase|eukprot:COSAG01_NODE_102_length_26290_cov_94.760299_21_plen_63_part_00
MPLGMGEPFAAERGWATGSTARQWREGMIELAKCPNVFVKLGGLTQPHAGERAVARPLRGLF